MKSMKKSTASSDINTLCMRCYEVCIITCMNIVIMEIVLVARSSLKFGKNASMRCYEACKITCTNVVILDILLVDDGKSSLKFDKNASNITIHLV